MSGIGNRDQFRLGFLTAFEDPERGYVGGLLVTNRFGRPLEFQCTTPVKPNRTQQILYGPTLGPYVFCELIGRTLVEKVGVKPQLVLTVHSDLLELRNHVGIPVACFETSAAESPAESHLLKLGNQRLCFHGEHPGDRELIEKHAALIPPDADLQEPFQRVQEALMETIRPAAAAMGGGLGTSAPAARPPAA